VTYTATNRTVFDDTLRTQYLNAVTNGMRLGPAAHHVGISPDVPARHARTDPAFGRALTTAKVLGKKTRQEDIPHSEYRYNCHKCRCDICCTAATKARASRRAAAEHDADEGQSAPPGQVHEIRPAPKSLPSFLLARAS
jgi:hypothetical protein